MLLPKLINFISKSWKCFKSFFAIAFHKSILSSLYIYFKSVQNCNILPPYWDLSRKNFPLVISHGIFQNYPSGPMVLFKMLKSYVWPSENHSLLPLIGNFWKSKCEVEIFATKFPLHILYIPDSSCLHFFTSFLLFISCLCSRHIPLASCLLPSTFCPLPFTTCLLLFSTPLPFF